MTSHAPDTGEELTPLYREILDFETQFPVWRYLGAKETEIRTRFDLTAVRYYQILNHLLGLPAAEAYQPMTVRRLRRLRDQRRTTRSRRGA